MALVVMAELLTLMTSTEISTISILLQTPPPLIVGVLDSHLKSLDLQLAGSEM